MSALYEARGSCRRLRVRNVVIDPTTNARASATYILIRLIGNKRIKLPLMLKLLQDHELRQLQVLARAHF